MKVTQRNIDNIIYSINRRVQTTTSEEKKFITDLLINTIIDSFDHVEYSAGEIASLLDVRVNPIIDVIATEFNIDE